MKPRLETERLILRPIVQSDAEDLYEYSKDTRVSDMTAFEPHQSIEETYEVLENVFFSRPSKGWPEAFAIVLKSTNKMIGTCDFWPVRSANAGVYEMGYALHPDYWHLGYMTEAASRVIQFAFEDYYVRRLELNHYGRNIGSRKVAEHVGFRYEGTRRNACLLGYGYDDYVEYGLLQEEYYDRKISKKI